ncbi:uncharacterized protein B0H18DRAFT_966818 [Fomitopsis serialis]|uniref:uncharacterized protein n=1 Tax=Fomitopsis serialis TaxID=139415 RepID=UPI002008571B|nr:uncharacterized protein B0H18DRAFT_966818 [Neoantrodia serialis]KAH9938368.1 hypothetical protein B0H18DRAFT_966818 [Neoantrodia serialis]
MLYRLALLCIIPTFALSAWAQFQFFEHMFGQPMHQQQQRPPGPSGAGQWIAHADSVACSQYLCPETLVCVSSPSDCPCPDSEDIKCLVPDAKGKHRATVVCTRGAIDCKHVERLASKLA